MVFGAGVVQQVGALARALGAKHVLLVTDPGLVAAGHAARVTTSLQSVGIPTTLFAHVHENPTTTDVAACVAVAQQAQIDFLIGLGGGSAMDTAKGANFLLTNGGAMRDYWGVGKATQPMLPFMAIPTTAGTGSEMQCAALIADAETHQKMACLDPKCAAQVALLDPELTLSQPPRVTACTGIDAIAHAVETAVTTKRTALSQSLSQEALQLCLPALPAVLARPTDLLARAQMQLGAAYAGAAIEQSMLGAAHAAANPLTAAHGIVHGHAVGLMLPAVVRWNAQLPEIASLYARLATAVGLEVPSPAAAGDLLAARLESLLPLAALPNRLSQCGVPAAALPALAAGAAKQWTAGFNPRPLTEADFLALYEAVFA